MVRACDARHTYVRGVAETSRVAMGVICALCLRTNAAHPHDDHTPSEIKKSFLNNLGMDSFNSYYYSKALIPMPSDRQRQTKCRYQSGIIKWKMILVEQEQSGMTCIHSLATIVELLSHSHHISCTLVTSGDLKFCPFLHENTCRILIMLQCEYCYQLGDSEFQTPDRGSTRGSRVQNQNI